jgi:hypothetical protein
VVRGKGSRRWEGEENFIRGREAEEVGVTLPQWKALDAFSVFV